MDSARWAADLSLPGLSPIASETEGDPMSRPGPATQAKRNRERARTERKQEKLEKRLARKDQKKDRERLVDEGVDPDLVGIYPGPQPLPSED